VKLALSVAALISLAACGGGSASSEYQQAVDLANAKETEARALAVETPCSDASQCGTVAFLDPVKVCPFFTYKPYSLVSPSAQAASAAAAQQQSLADEAHRLDPASSVTSCPPPLQNPPPIACVASKCQVAS